MGTKDHIGARSMLLWIVLLAGCASQVPVQSAQLASLASPAADLEIQRPVSVRLSTGYERMLAARSRWRAVGVLPEGIVYRPLDTVFAIEGRHVHEAYLVVRASAVQGFYLPAESKFSPLSPSLPLP